MEEEFRVRLEAKRLVAELRLTADDYENLRHQAAQIVGFWGGGRETWRRFPALLVAYLVAEGIFSYDGSFWPHTIRGLDAQTAGPAFEKALSSLGLETFAYLVRDDNALRFVGPILAHGGIPKYCLGDFFALLTGELRNGSADAGDILAVWRTRRTRFQGIDQPVRRFLLFGGDLARDLVDRCIDMVEQASLGSVPDEAIAGLPAYVIEEYDRCRRRSGPVVGSRRSLPRPRVALDPWETLGPVLVLPSVELPEATWRASLGDSSTSSLDALRHREQSLGLKPARSWEVELFQAGERTRSYVFECFDDIEAAFFDPGSGQLVRDPRQLSLEAVWVLAPPEARLASLSTGGELRCIEELPSPTGDWHGYRLACFDLEGVTAFEVGGRASSALVRVKRPTERPHLIGVPVEGVLTPEGDPVYSRPPSIRLPAGLFGPEAWRLRLRSREHDILSGPVTNLMAGDEPTVSLEPFLAGRGVGLFSVAVQGPLGSDLPQTTFAVVEGLLVRRPERLLMPEERHSTVTLRGDSTVDLDGAGCSAGLLIPEGVDSVQCRATSGRRVVELRIRVPRLLWGIVRRDGLAMTLSDSLVRIDADELRDGTAAALVVRTGKEGSRLQLRLRAGSALEQSEEAIARGDEGRWTFDLGRLADTIHASLEPTLRLDLVADGRTVRVATVNARLQVENIAGVSRIAQDFTSVHLTFDESAPLHGRVARLWPLDRPWAPVIEEPIADEVVGEAQLSGYSRIFPGRYLAEIALDDGWAARRRPTRRAPNTAVMTVGDDADLAAYLDELDPDDPWTALELAAIRGAWPEERPPGACQLE